MAALGGLHSSWKKKQTGSINRFQNRFTKFFDTSENGNALLLTKENESVASYPAFHVYQNVFHSKATRNTCASIQKSCMVKHI
jgi:hypothetical protein